MKSKKHPYAGVLLGLTLAAALAVLGLAYHREIVDILTRQAARDAFVSSVRRSGAAGFAAFLGLQVLQVVVAVLPGEPVELMAGALYGTWGGLGVCLLGLLPGSMVVYGAVRLLGAARIDPALLHKYRFLRDDAHVEFALFLLYFIPGTPKDALLYVGPFLPVRPAVFFAIALTARIPSILTSTCAGASFVQGNWRMSLAVFSVTGLAALTCILLQERILQALARWKTCPTALRRKADARLCATRAARGEHRENAVPAERITSPEPVDCGESAAYPAWAGCAAGIARARKPACSAKTDKPAPAPDDL